MVKVREDHHISEEGHVDIERWIQHLSEQTKLDDIEVICGNVQTFQRNRQI